MKDRNPLILWRAEWDKSENYYAVEIKRPFPWENVRSPKLSLQRTEAERLVGKLGVEKALAARKEVVTEVQRATGVSRTQARNAVDKAIRNTTD